ncbi:MAG: TIGR04255 family protein [Sphingomicrobium sp.]
MEDPSLHKTKGESRRYPNPPITEAVIEVKFDAAALDDERRHVSAKVAEFYPNDSVSEHQAVHLDMERKRVELRTDSSVYRRSSHDESEILLLGPQNFLLSQLAVYPGWDYFFGRFRRDWEIWRKAMGYRKIARIGVRFINRIDVPMEGTEVHHEQYLNLRIKMPDEFELIGDYSLHVEVPLLETKCLALINSASVPSPVPGFASFVIDIDIGRNIDVPQKDADMFDVLNQIRVQKNALFEASITDSAREKFFNEHQLR